MDKPILYWQKDVFPEDEIPFAKKFFDVKEMSYIDILKNKKDLTQNAFSFRGSNAFATALGINQDMFSMHRWVPHLEQWMIPSDYYWTTAKKISENPVWPKFIRPDSGKKTFSGQVFTKSKWEEEYNYLKQRNSNNILCFINTNPLLLRIECRCLFVGTELVGANEYMYKGEIMEKFRPCTRPDMIEKAKEIRRTSFFTETDNVTIDVCDFCFDYERVCLVEINMLETAGWYMKDVESAYRKMREQLG